MKGSFLLRASKFQTKASSQTRALFMTRFLRRPRPERPPQVWFNMKPGLLAIPIRNVRFSNRYDINCRFLYIIQMVYFIGFYLLFKTGFSAAELKTVFLKILEKLGFLPDCTILPFMYPVNSEVSNLIRWYLMNYGAAVRIQVASCWDTVVLIYNSI